MLANYGINYRLDFCDVLGVKKRIDILKRDYAGVIMPFVGSGNPISLTYKNDSDDKFNQITGSEATIRIIANPNLDLNTFYSEDERMWLVKFYSGDFTGNNWDDTRMWNDYIPWEDFTPNEGTHLAWTGYLKPDSASEPFQHIYSFEIKASDVLGTLKTTPYALDDTTLIKKIDSFKNILIQCLNKTDLRLNTIISTDTFETSMTYASSSDLSLSQAYIDTNRFIDGNNKPFSCYDVIKHICNQFSANIRQINGKWHFIDVTQYVYNSFTGVEFTPETGLVDVITINANKVVEPDEIVNADATFTKEPAYKTVTTYYQFGHLINKLANGNFNQINPLPMAERFPNWHEFGGLILGSGRKSVLTPEGEVPIDDYYAVIDNGSLTKGFTADPISVLKTNKISVSSYVRWFDNEISSSDDFYMRFQLKLSAPGKPDKFWNNQWVTAGSGPDTYKTVIIGGADEFVDGLSVGFDASYPEYDGTLTLSIFGVINQDDESVRTQIDDVEIKLDESQYYKSAIGYVTQAINFDKYSKSPDPVVLMFGDDDIKNKNRTSWMRNQSGVPTSTWFKKNNPSYIPAILQSLIARNIITQYQKPSRRFEGSLRGDFTPLDALTIPLTANKFMFMSGTFDVKSATANLVLGEIFTNNFTGFRMSAFDDYGDFKDESGKQVGSASGINLSPVSNIDTGNLIRNTSEYQPNAQLNIAKGTFQEEIRIPKVGGGTRKIYIA